MSGTTSLDDLPVSPQSEANIQLNTTETNVKIDSTVNKMQAQRQADITPPKNDRGADPGGHSGLGGNINNFVAGVQEAVATGALDLQSRDIAQVQTHITQDPQIQPNYVPSIEHNDYIMNDQSTNDIVQQNINKRNTEDSYDVLFNNLQTPIILALLYFIFQLPVVKQTVFRLVPSLFKNDGTQNLYGFIVHSVSFACVYQSIIFTLQYFSL